MPRELAGMAEDGLSPSLSMCSLNRMPATALVRLLDLDRAGGAFRAVHPSRSWRHTRPMVFRRDCASAYFSVSVE